MLDNLKAAVKRSSSCAVQMLFKLDDKRCPPLAVY